MSEQDNQIRLLKELIKLPNETEWVEFKHNNAEPKMIGEYISALANSATLFSKRHYSSRFYHDRDGTYD